MSWERISLHECIDTTKGFAFKSEWFSADGVPVVKVKDFTTDSIDIKSVSFIPVSIARNYEKYTLRTDDIIIQTVGSWPSNPNSVVGKVIRVPKESDGALLNQNAVKIIPNQKIESKFLFYLLRLDEFKAYIIGTAQGSASQASITLDAIRRYEPIIPLLPVQQKIAGILSAYDDLLDNNRKRIALLEKAARLLYEEWFVRLRFPGHEHTPVVDGVPQGWERKVLSDVVELNYGKALKSDDRIEGEFPVYGSSGEVGTHNKAIVKGPAIIVGRKGNVGSIFWSSKSCYPIDTVYYINTEQISPFIYYNLQYQHFINNDGAVPGLNRGYAYSRPVLMPSNTLFTQFNGIAQATIDQIEKLSSFNQKLQQARDLLLPRLMSGELAV